MKGNYGTVKNKIGVDKWKLVMLNPKNSGRSLHLTYVQ